MLGIAARLAAKKLAKKQLDDVPDYFEKAKAAEKTAKKRDIAEKVGIGAGTVAVAPIAAELGSQYGQQAEDLRELGKEKRASEKLQKQYEEQDKQEGRKMKAGGMVSSASKRADGCVSKGKTKGKMR